MLVLRKNKVIKDFYFVQMKTQITGYQLFAFFFSAIFCFFYFKFGFAIVYIYVFCYVLFLNKFLNN
jgi:hypothetical protein